MNLRLTRLRLCTAVVLFSAGLFVSCATRETSPGVYLEFRPLAGSLGGYDTNANYEAMHALFAVGRAAIPALVEVLNSETDFWIECGLLSLLSETIRVDSESDVIDGHPRFVGEVALYLIESILRSNIYFAMTCSLEVDGIDVTNSLEVQERLAPAASSLRELSPSELENITLQDFEDIMKNAGLAFPTKRKH